MLKKFKLERTEQLNHHPALRERERERSIGKRKNVPDEKEYREQSFGG
jgi:hypothetical protein